MAYPPTERELAEFKERERLAEEAADRMVAAGEERLRIVLHPTILDRINPANWSDGTKAKLKAAGIGALKAGLIAGATALGLKSEIVAAILSQIFG
jgi:hypothetical protein